MKRDKYVYLKKSKKYNTRTSFLADFLKNKKIKLLDVGNLGDGDVNIDVRKIVEDNNGSYYGLDCNENLAKEMKLTNQLIGDLHDLSNVVKDDEFDVVYAGQVIEHSWEPGKIIKECRRIVKDGGFLVLDTPNSYDIWSIIRYFLKKKDTVGMDDNILGYNEAVDSFKNYRSDDKNLLSQPQHKIFYTTAMLRQLLNMHGFEVLDFAFIKKPQNIFHKTLLLFFPHGSSKIGVVAKKNNLEEIYTINN